MWHYGYQECSFPQSLFVWQYHYSSVLSLTRADVIRQCNIAKHQIVHCVPQSNECNAILKPMQSCTQQYFPQALRAIKSNKNRLIILLSFCGSTALENLSEDRDCRTICNHTPCHNLLFMHNISFNISISEE